MATRHQLGHRSRARDKFIRHGSQVLEAYELFELLLFSCIPVKDTKGIAKDLLAAFPNISKLLRAEEEELTAVSGIGRGTAALIRALSEAFDICFAEKPRELKPSAIPDYHICGKLLVDNYKRRDDQFVLMISFDNSMNILGIDEVYKLPYSSGGVKPAGFLKSAVKRGASVAVTAFNHPSGPLFPLPSEMQTVKMLESAFEDAGIFLAEQYLISGDKYLGIMQHLEFAFAQRTPEISDFLKSKASLPKNLDCSYAFSSELQGDSDASAAVLGKILKYTKTENPVAMAEKLMAHFGSLRAVFEADFGALASVSADERVCFMIRLSAAIFARSLTESVKVGKKCADDALRRFAVGVFFAMPYEETHIFCFDKEGRFLGESRVSEGTVNSSEILPRRILDTAYAFGADSIILAHNHPRGHTSPSNADRDTTEYIASFLAPLGITLKAHYIVADGTAENFL